MSKPALKLKTSAESKSDFISLSYEQPLGQKGATPFYDFINTENEALKKVPVALAGSVDNDDKFWQIAGGGMNGEMEKYLKRIGGLVIANAALAKGPQRSGGAENAIGTVQLLDLTEIKGFKQGSQVQKILYSASPDLRNTEEKKIEAPEAERLMTAFGKKFRTQLSEKRITELCLPLYSGGVYSGDHSQENIAEWLMEGWLAAEEEAPAMGKVKVYLGHQCLVEAVAKLTKPAIKEPQLTSPALAFKVPAKVNESATNPEPSREIVKARNSRNYAYSDREIDAVNVARNTRDSISYHASEGIFTGILKNRDGSFLKNEGKMVVELPACDAAGAASPIFARLKEQFDHLLKLEREGEEIYPLKILFPYKVIGWHWNAGEIVVIKGADKKLRITGTAYDPLGGGQLDQKIQDDIKRFFEGRFGKPDVIFDLNTQSRTAKVQKGGVACGLYAARAIHNLKTKGNSLIWQGVLDRDEIRNDQELRNEDSALMSDHGNREALAKFCAPLNERLFKDIKALSREAYQEEKEMADFMLGRIREGSSSVFNQELFNILLAINTAEGETQDIYNKAFKDLAKLTPNKFQEIFFTIDANGDRGDAIFTVESIAIVFNAYSELRGDHEASGDYGSEGFEDSESKRYDECLELIMGSYSEAVSRIAGLNKSGELNTGELNVLVERYGDEVTSVINERGLSEASIANLMQNLAFVRNAALGKEVAPVSVTVAEFDLLAEEEEALLQNIRDPKKCYDFQSVNNVINAAVERGDGFKFVEYNAQIYHEESLIEGIKSFKDLGLARLAIPMRPVRPPFDSEVGPQVREHFTALYVEKKEGGLLEVFYIDPTGNGKVEDIPEYVMDKLVPLGIDAVNIKLTTNKIQHCTESRKDEVVLDDGSTHILQTDGSPTNVHCGAFIADILSGLITGEKSILEGRIGSIAISDDGAPAWQDLPDLGKEDSDLKGRELRGAHLELLARSAFKRPEIDGGDPIVELVKVYGENDGWRDGEDGYDSEDSDGEDDDDHHHGGGEEPNSAKEGIGTGVDLSGPVSNIVPADGEMASKEPAPSIGLDFVVAPPAEEIGATVGLLPEMGLPSGVGTGALHEGLGPVTIADTGIDEELDPVEVVGAKKDLWEGVDLEGSPLDTIIGAVLNDDGAPFNPSPHGDSGAKSAGLVGEIDPGGKAETIAEAVLSPKEVADVRGAISDEIYEEGDEGGVDGHEGQEIDIGRAIGAELIRDATPDPLLRDDSSVDQAKLKKEGEDGSCLEEAKNSSGPKTWTEGVRKGGDEVFNPARKLRDYDEPYLYKANSGGRVNRRPFSLTRASRRGLEKVVEETPNLGSEIERMKVEADGKITLDFKNSETEESDQVVIELNKNKFVEVFIEGHGEPEVQIKNTEFRKELMKYYLSGTGKSEEARAEYEVTGEEERKIGKEALEVLNIYRAVPSTSVTPTSASRIAVGDLYKSR